MAKKKPARSKKPAKKATRKKASKRKVKSAKRKPAKRKATRKKVTKRKVKSAKRKPAKRKAKRKKASKRKVKRKPAKRKPAKKAAKKRKPARRKAKKRKPAKSRSSRQRSSARHRVYNLTKEVPEHHYFVLANGRPVKHVAELASILDQLEDHVFGHHVRADKNDFHDWIKDIFQDVELAKKMAGVAEKKRLQLVIYRHLAGHD